MADPNQVTLYQLPNGQLLSASELGLVIQQQAAAQNVRQPSPANTSASEMLQASQQAPLVIAPNLQPLTSPVGQQPQLVMVRPVTSQVSTPRAPTSQSVVRSPANQGKKPPNKAPQVMMMPAKGLLQLPPGFRLTAYQHPPQKGKKSVSKGLVQLTTGTQLATAQHPPSAAASPSGGIQQQQQTSIPAVTAIRNIPSPKGMTHLPIGVLDHANTGVTTISGSSSGEQVLKLPQKVAQLPLVQSAQSEISLKQSGKRSRPSSKSSSQFQSKSAGHVFINSVKFLPVSVPPSTSVSSKKQKSSTDTTISSSVLGVDASENAPVSISSSTIMSTEVSQSLPLLSSPSISAPPQTLHPSTLQNVIPASTSSVQAASPSLQSLSNVQVADVVLNATSSSPQRSSVPKSSAKVKAHSAASPSGFRIKVPISSLNGQLGFTLPAGILRRAKTLKVHSAGSGKKAGSPQVIDLMSQNSMPGQTDAEQVSTCSEDMSENITDQLGNRTLDLVATVQPSLDSNKLEATTLSVQQEQPRPPTEIKLQYNLRDTNQGNLGVTSLKMGEKLVTVPPKSGNEDVHLPPDSVKSNQCLLPEGSSECVFLQDAGGSLPFEVQPEQIPDAVMCSIEDVVSEPQTSVCGPESAAPLGTASSLTPLSSILENTSLSSGMVTQVLSEASHPMMELPLESFEESPARQDGNLMHDVIHIQSESIPAPQPLHESSPVVSSNLPVQHLDPPACMDVQVRSEMSASSVPIQHAQLLPVHSQASPQTSLMSVSAPTFLKSGVMLSTSGQVIMPTVTKASLPPPPLPHRRPQTKYTNKKTPDPPEKFPPASKWTNRRTPDPPTEDLDISGEISSSGQVVVPTVSKASLPPLARRPPAAKYTNIKTPDPPEKFPPASKWTNQRTPDPPTEDIFDEIVCEDKDVAGEGNPFFTKRNPIGQYVESKLLPSDSLGETYMKYLELTNGGKTMTYHDFLKAKYSGKLPAQNDSKSSLKAAKAVFESVSFPVQAGTEPVDKDAWLVPLQPSAAPASTKPKSTEVETVSQEEDVAAKSFVTLPAQVTMLPQVAPGKVLPPGVNIEISPTLLQQVVQAAGLEIPKSFLDNEKEHSTKEDAQEVVGSDQEKSSIQAVGMTELDTASLENVNGTNTEILSKSISGDKKRARSAAIKTIADKEVVIQKTETSDPKADKQAFKIVGCLTYGVGICSQIFAPRLLLPYGDEAIGDLAADITLRDISLETKASSTGTCFLKPIIYEIPESFVCPYEDAGSVKIGVRGTLSESNMDFTPSTKKHCIGQDPISLDPVTESREVCEPEKQRNGKKKDKKRSATVQNIGQEGSHTSVNPKSEGKDKLDLPMIDKNIEESKIVSQENIFNETEEEKKGSEDVKMILNPSDALTSFGKVVGHCTDSEHKEASFTPVANISRHHAELKSDNLANSTEIPDPSQDNDSADNTFDVLSDDSMDTSICSKSNPLVAGEMGQISDGHGISLDAKDGKVDSCKDSGMVLLEEGANTDQVSASHDEDSADRNLPSNSMEITCSKDKTDVPDRNESEMCIDIEVMSGDERVKEKSAEERSDSPKGSVKVELSSLDVTSAFEAAADKSPAKETEKTSPLESIDKMVITEVDDTEVIQDLLIGNEDAEGSTQDDDDDDDDFSVDEVLDPPVKVDEELLEFLLSGESKNLDVCDLVRNQDEGFDGATSGVCYGCYLCAYASKYQREVMDHWMREHLQHKPYQCPYCKVESVTSQRIQHHIVQHHPGAPAVISLVPSSIYQEAIEIDMRIVDNDDITVPSIDIQEKRRVETEDSEAQATSYIDIIFQCIRCEFSTQRVSAIREHVRTVHLKVKSYMCPYCARKFSTSLNAKRHISIHHPTESMRIYVSKMGATKISLEHINRYFVVHPLNDSGQLGGKSPSINVEKYWENVKTEADDDLMCRRCSYVCKNVSEMWGHVRTLHEVPRYCICMMCEHTHLLKRTERLQCWAVCANCKSIISLSLDSDTSVIFPKMFMCLCCNYRTHERSGMIRHIKYVHVKCHAFMCPYCPYKGVEKPKVRLHIQMHHPKRPLLVAKDEMVITRFMTIIRGMFKEILPRTRSLSSSNAVYDPAWDEKDMPDDLTIDEGSGDEAANKPSDPQVHPSVQELRNEVGYRVGIRYQERGPTVTDLGDLVQHTKTAGMKPNTYRYYMTEEFAGCYHFKCVICHYRCVDRSCMARHVKYIHLRAHPHKCVYCEYSNVEKTKVKLHIQAFHKGLPVHVTSDSDMISHLGKLVKRYFVAVMPDNTEKPIRSQNLVNSVKSKEDWIKWALEYMEKPPKKGAKQAKSPGTKLNPEPHLLDVANVSSDEDWMPKKGRPRKKISAAEKLMQSLPKKSPPKKSLPKKSLPKQPPSKRTKPKPQQSPKKSQAKKRKGKPLQSKPAKVPKLPEDTVSKRRQLAEMLAIRTEEVERLRAQAAACSVSGPSPKIVMNNAETGTDLPLIKSEPEDDDEYPSTSSWSGMEQMVVEEIKEEPSSDNENSLSGSPLKTLGTIRAATPEEREVDLDPMEDNDLEDIEALLTRVKKETAGLQSAREIYTKPTRNPKRYCKQIGGVKVEPSVHSDSKLQTRCVVPLEDVIQEILSSYH